MESATLLEKVSAWVGSRLNYVPGSSDPIDGAVDTLLAGAGVCRDYAHLVVAMLRAVNVPARVVSVYAPGLYPMDFHAVGEAFVDFSSEADGFKAAGLADSLVLARSSVPASYVCPLVFVHTAGPRGGCGQQGRR